VSSVRSVVASLWAVDDDATNLLMQEFYKNLQTMDKVEALRKAQATLSTTAGFEHPFYWGAFVLYGDWR
jgi:CHAT domain-containing protein